MSWSRTSPLQQKPTQTRTVYRQLYGFSFDRKQKYRVCSLILSRWGHGSITGTTMVKHRIPTSRESWGKVAGSCSKDRAQTESFNSMITSFKLLLSKNPTQVSPLHSCQFKVWPTSNRSCFWYLMMVMQLFNFPDSRVSLLDGTRWKPHLPPPFFGSGGMNLLQSNVAL